MPSNKRVSIKNNSPLDNLFGPSVPVTESGGKREVSENGETNEPGVQEQLRQTTIMVSDEQLDWLDQKCTEARSKGGKPIRKAVVIRTLIDLARSSGVDLSGLKNEQDLSARIERAIKAKKTG